MTRKKLHFCEKVSERVVNGPLKGLEQRLLDMMRGRDPHASIDTCEVMLHVESDFYSQCSCSADLELHAQREETDGEVEARQQVEQQLKEAEKERRRQQRAAREISDRAEYERLKKKFEKSTRSRQ